MIYKVGDRVKRVHSGPSERNLIPIPLGAEGTVLQGMHESYWPVPIVHVTFDNGLYDGIVFAWTLAPLTPPDAWAESKVRELVKPKPMDVERAVEKIREVFPSF